MSWLTKLKKFFMGHVEVDEPIQPKPDMRTSSFALREIGSRVQHIYPQPGKRHTSSFQNNEDRLVTTNKYFQGTLSHAKETPSPIFGYRFRREERAETTEFPVEQKKRHDEKPVNLDEKVIDTNKEVINMIEAEPKKEWPQVSLGLGENSIAPAKHVPLHAYQTPDLSSLQVTSEQEEAHDEEWTTEQAELLMKTFKSFNLQAELIGITKGPTVTRFEIQPAPGIKINKFTNLQDDLKLSLAVQDIRIEAPIPGKQAIGIEVPNLKPRPVLLGELLTSKEFQEAESPLTICLGTDLSGQPVVTDIQKMPHGLIAGSTGSGKSVCINSILVSLLYKSNPNQLRLLLIDPKVVELSPYQRIPHLVTPVVTDPKKANAALKWAVQEMEHRYQLFAELGVRDLERYNQALATETGEEFSLPYLVIIIDELADLMMVSPQEVEDSICRLTQKARACGIHLIVATQRPSVDVITGLIKANIPTRLAFSVSSQVDSRTILDMAGAERLLGKGDMLFLPSGAGKAFRVQGSYVSDEEIEEVVNQIAVAGTDHFLFTSDDLSSTNQSFDVDDELISDAVLYVFEQGVASASSLQRKFRIGYNRAARMIEWMEEQGMISESLGSKPRTVIWDEEQFLQWLESQ